MSGPAQYRDEAAWLEARKTAIGGSEAGAIVGLDPFRTALDLYNEKLGLAPPKPDTPAMQRGRFLEPIACDIYSAITGRKLRRQPLRRHPQYPFIACSLDRQILANGDDRGTGLLEVKAPGMRVFSRVKREGLPSSWLLQMQHNLGGWGYRWGSYAIFSGELWSLVHFDVERDDAFIEGLFEAERRFWHEHVQKVVPPPASGMLHAALTELDEMPPIEGQLVQRDDPEWAEAAVNLAQARTLRGSAEAVEEAAISRVKELAGSLGVYEGGDLRVYWKQQPGRVTFDKKALAASQPLDRMKVFAALAEYKGPAVPLDLIAGISEDLAKCGVDFNQFEKVGKPFETFRSYFLKPQGPEDE